MSNASCVVFGGAGFIGTHLARHFIATGRFSRVHLVDIERSPLEGMEGVSASMCDVRRPIPVDLTSSPPEWIFNLAAVHREPGHDPHEYFGTNLAGARNVCDYAQAVSCRRIYFTSSISVYGPTSGPTDEASPICPVTPYGGSKYPAELMHGCWQSSAPGRRLIVCRPAVVYGPGDPGNILRMIRAIRRGYFAFPGSASVYKAYAYIFGLLDSIDFVMDRAEAVIYYNYAEAPAEPLGNLVLHTKDFLDSSAPVFRVPLGLLMPAARAAQVLLGASNPIHPTRVRKAAMSTHIVPAWLMNQGFQFRFSFVESLKHWKSVAPEDFA